MLLVLPEMQLRVFPQGDWGAKSTKPTALLSARMPFLPVAMMRWRRPTPFEERVVSNGRSADGYKTAVLKEYPPFFSAGLAQGVYESLKRRQAQGDIVQKPPLEPTLQNWLEKALTVGEVVQQSAAMQPDYQPQGNV